MKDHPDEFLMRRKWDELINEFGGYFTEEELNAYKVARSEMMRDLFNEAVLKRLAGEEETQTQPSTATYRAQEKYATGTVDSQSLFGQAIMNNPMLAAKQANAAMQQAAYNTAIQQQQGLLQNSGIGKAFTRF
jgi:hypothetical protein